MVHERHRFAHPPFYERLFQYGKKYSILRSGRMLKLTTQKNEYHELRKSKRFYPENIKFIFGGNDIYKGENDGIKTIVYPKTTSVLSGKSFGSNLYLCTKFPDKEKLKNYMGSFSNYIFVKDPPAV